MVTKADYLRNDNRIIDNSKKGYKINTEAWFGIRRMTNNNKINLFCLLPMLRLSQFIDVKFKKWKIYNKNVHINLVIGKSVR